MKASEYLVEIDAHDGVGVRTERVSTGGYTTGPADSPANAWYAASVADPGFFRRDLFGQGRTLGESDVAYGEIRLINPDGLLDAWLDYGFAGRPVVVKRLASRDAAYASAEVILRAAVESIDSSDAWMGFRLRVYDRRLELDRPLQTNRYAGTTVATGPTATGTVDIKDQPKPMCFGRCFNVPGLSVNPFDLIYQVHDGVVNAIVVFDGGVPLTSAGDFASVAALQSATIKPGRYGTCLALGLFRLGAAPAFKITADVDEGSSAAQRRAGAVVTRMLAKMGFAGSDLVSASFTALDGAAPYQVGLYLADDLTGREAMSKVLASVGAWIVPNGNGAFEVGQLRAPGTPAGTITEADMLTGGQGIGLVSNPDTDGGIPAWRVVLRYQPSFEVQDDAVLGVCVDMARRGAVAQAVREVRVEDATVKTKHLLAPELVIETVLATASNAATEAQRRLDLYGVRRDVLTFPVAQDDAYALGATVKVMLDRFGYQTGRDMVVIGRNEDLANETVTLTVWG